MNTTISASLSRGPQHQPAPLLPTMGVTIAPCETIEALTTEDIARLREAFCSSCGDVDDAQQRLLGMDEFCHLLEREGCPARSRENVMRLFARISGDTRQGISWDQFFSHVASGICGEWTASSSRATSLSSTSSSSSSSASSHAHRSSSSTFSPTPPSSSCDLSPFPIDHATILDLPLHDPVLRVDYMPPSLSSQLLAGSQRKLYHAGARAQADQDIVESTPSNLGDFSPSRTAPTLAAAAAEDDLDEEGRGLSNADDRWQEELLGPAHTQSPGRVVCIRGDGSLTVVTCTLEPPVAGSVQTPISAALHSVRADNSLLRPSTSPPLPSSLSSAASPNTTSTTSTTAAATATAANISASSSPPISLSTAPLSSSSTSSSPPSSLPCAESHSAPLLATSMYHLSGIQRSVRVIDAVVMGSLNRMAVAMSNRSLRFYDISPQALDGHAAASGGPSSSTSTTTTNGQAGCSSISSFGSSGKMKGEDRSRQASSSTAAYNATPSSAPYSSSSTSSPFSFSTANTVSNGGTERSHLEPAFEITHLEDNAVCLGFHPSSDPGTCTLLAGDSGGAVNTFTFFTARTNLHSKTDTLDRPSLTFAELFDPVRHHILKPARHKVHKEWVNKVVGFHKMGSFISCSSGDGGSSGDSLVIFDGVRKVARMSVRKGISCFDFSPSWRCVVAGAGDGILRVLNSRLRCTAQMEGHKAALCLVSICESGHGRSQSGGGGASQGKGGSDGDGGGGSSSSSSSSSCHEDPSALVVSVADDQAVKIWSLKDQTCLQTLCSHRFAFGKTRACSVLFRPDLGILFLAGTQVACYVGAKPLQNKSAPQIQVQAVREAFCSALFKEVVTVCESGTVQVWDVVSGAPLLEFSSVGSGRQPATMKSARAALSRESITAICLDTECRLLLLARVTGAVEVWNFQSGHLVETLEPAVLLTPPSLLPKTLSSTTITCLARLAPSGNVIAADAHCVHMRRRCKARALQADLVGSHSHSGTILTMAVHPSSRFFATADDAGHVMLWRSGSLRRVAYFRPDSSSPTIVDAGAAGSDAFDVNLGKKTAADGTGKDCYGHGDESNDGMIRGDDHESKVACERQQPEHSDAADKIFAIHHLVIVALRDLVDDGDDDDDSNFGANGSGDLSRGSTGKSSQPHSLRASARGFTLPSTSNSPNTPVLPFLRTGSSIHKNPRSHLATAPGGAMAVGREASGKEGDAYQPAFLVIGAGARGMVQVWDDRLHFLTSFCATSMDAACEPVACMDAYLGARTTRKNRKERDGLPKRHNAEQASHVRIYTGDTAGCVQVWDLAVDNSPAPLSGAACDDQAAPVVGSSSPFSFNPPILVSSWCALDEPVLSVRHIKHARIPVLVCAGQDGTTTLWKEDGTAIGTLGRPIPDTAWRSTRIVDFDSKTTATHGKDAPNCLPRPGMSSNPAGRTGGPLSVCPSRMNVPRSLHPFGLAGDYDDVGASEEQEQQQRDDHLSAAAMVLAARLRAMKKHRDRLALEVPNPLLGLGYHHLPWVPLAPIPEHPGLPLQVDKTRRYHGSGSARSPGRTVAK